MTNIGEITLRCVSVQSKQLKAKDGETLGKGEWVDFVTYASNEGGWRLTAPRKPHFDDLPDTIEILVRRDVAEREVSR